MLENLVRKANGIRLYTVKLCILSASEQGIPPKNNNNGKALDVGRVHEEAVYESNMPIESCIKSNRVGLPITPIPDWFFGTFAARIF